MATSTTTEVKAEERVEGEGAEVAETHTEPKTNDETTTLKADKVEKPLPEPTPEQRSRLLSFSRLRNILPKPREDKDEPHGADATATATSPTEGAGRRLLHRVGNAVNRRSKAVSSDTEAEAPTATEKAAAEPSTEGAVALEENTPAPAEIVSEDQTPAESKQPKEEESEAAETKPEDDSTAAAAAASPSSPLQAVASRATKLARRLSARGLGSVFQSKAKADPTSSSSSEAPPVSKASLLAQELSAESAPAPQEPQAPEAVEAKDDAELSTPPVEDKELPPPPPPAPQAEDDKPAKSPAKERPPPTSFKSATRLARRLSTGASGIFRQKPEEEQGSKPGDGLAGAEDAESGDTEATGHVPSSEAHLSPTLRAAQLVRQISTRAQDTYSKARSRSRVRQAKAGVEAEATKSGSKEGEGSAPSAEESKEGAIAAASTSVEVEGVSPETTKAPEAKPEAELDSEKALPSAPSSAHPPSAAVAISRVGQLGLRLTNRLGGIFAGGKDHSDATTAAETPVPAAVDGGGAAAEDVAVPAESKDVPAESETKLEEGKPEDPVGEGAVAEVTESKKPEVETEVVTEGFAATTTTAAAPVATETESEAKDEAEAEVKHVDKSLPLPPPPSAAVSIAKVGQLTRQFSSRVGAVFRSGTTPKSEDVDGQKEEEVISVARGEAAGEAQKPKEGEEKEDEPTAVKPVDEATAVPSKEGESPPAESKDAEEKAPLPHTKEKDAPAPSGSSAAPPPGAFAKARKPKLGKRLSARVGDLFKSKTKEVEKGKEEKAESTATPAPVESKAGADGTHQEVKSEEASQEPAVVVEDENKEAGEEVVVVEKTAGKEGEDEVKAEAEEKKDSDVETDVEKPKVEETAQPEASTSAATPPEDSSEVKPDKPLPSKPSRSARAKEVAVDVRRQLSIKASELLKPRPKLEDGTAATTATSSSDKGKQREGSDVQHTEDTAPKRSLGRGISRRVVERVFGHKDEGVKPVNDIEEATVAGGEGKEKEDQEDASRDGPEAAPIPPAAEGAAAAEQDGESKPVSSEDVLKAASVEAVEGGSEVVEGPTKGEPRASTGGQAAAEEDPKDEVNGKVPRSGLQLPKSVTEFFKQRAASDKVLSPTEGEATLDDKEKVEGKEERTAARSRRLSLGFLSKKKKKGAEVTQEAKSESSPASPIAPEVPPKDSGALVEKEVTVPEPEEVEEKELPKSISEIPSEGGVVEEPVAAGTAVILESSEKVEAAKA